MKTKTINVIACVVVFLLSALLGAFIGMSAKEMKWIDILWAFLSFVVSIILLVNIHELGHLFFGKRAGYQLMMYKAGPFCWKYENGHFKFVLEKAKGYLGLCMMLSPITEPDRRANLLYFAGGILMNLLTGTMALVIAFLLQPSSFTLFLVFAIFGYLSICIGIINLLPSMNQNNPSDGMILWSLWKGNRFAEGFITINRLQMQLSMGVRPRDLTNLPVEEEENEEFTRLYFSVYRLYQAWDEYNLEKLQIIADRIDQQMSSVPSAVEQPVKIELCAAYATTGDMTKAQHYYTEVQARIAQDKDCNGYRIKAYYAWFAEKDKKSAIECCRHGLAVIDTYPLKGQALMEEDLLNRLLSTLENQQ